MEIKKIWNDDTVHLYPDLDRDRRLEAVRKGRYGGFTVDSLRREEERRKEYFEQGHKDEKHNG